MTNDPSFKKRLKETQQLNKDLNPPMKFDNGKLRYDLLPFDNNITLIKGDCLEVMDKLIEQDIKVDAIITDPPYGMSFQSNYRKEKYSEIKNDNSLSWLDDFIEKTYNILKNNSHGYIFCSFHHVDKFKQAIEKKFKLKNILIWEKNNTSMGDLKGDYAPKYEMIIYFHKGRRLLEGFRFPNIFKFSRTGNKLHPTQKPVDLLEFLLKNSSKENETIFDPFMGSGSTGVACQNTNRKFIGIELDDKYFKVAKKRIFPEDFF